MCRCSENQSVVNMTINVDPDAPVSEIKKAMDNIAEQIRISCVGLGNRTLEEAEQTNYDIAMEVFREIAQDINRSAQERMDACKLLLEYDC